MPMTMNGPRLKTRYCGQLFSETGSSNIFAAEVLVELRKCAMSPNSKPQVDLRRHNRYPGKWIWHPNFVSRVPVLMKSGKLMWNHMPMTTKSGNRITILQTSVLQPRSSNISALGRDISYWNCKIEYRYGGYMCLFPFWSFDVQYTKSVDLSVLVWWVWNKSPCHKTRRIEWWKSP